MIRVRLQMALDFASRNGVPHQSFTYQHEGNWYVCKAGPKYENRFLVTEYDEEGLLELRRYERVGEETHKVSDVQSHGEEIPGNCPEMDKGG